MVKRKNNESGGKARKAIKTGGSSALNVGQSDSSLSRDASMRDLNNTAGHILNESSSTVNIDVISTIDKICGICKKDGSLIGL